MTKDRLQITLEGLRYVQAQYDDRTEEFALLSRAQNIVKAEIEIMDAPHDLNINVADEVGSSGTLC